MQARYHLDLADRFAYLGYGPAFRLKPFRPHLAVGALSCAGKAEYVQVQTHVARQATGALPGGFPTRRPNPATMKLRDSQPLCSSCARRGITPACWLRTPLGAGPTGLPPARNMRRPAHTTAASDALPARHPLPG
jgi:hypothetical protein